MIFSPNLKTYNHYRRMHDNLGKDILLTIGACIDSHLGLTQSGSTLPSTEVLLYRTKTIRGINSGLAMGVENMSISTMSAIVGIIACDVEISKYVRCSNIVLIMLMPVNNLFSLPVHFFWRQRAVNACSRSPTCHLSFWWIPRLHQRGALDLGSALVSINTLALHCLVIALVLTETGRILISRDVCLSG